MKTHMRKMLTLAAIAFLGAIFALATGSTAFAAETSGSSSECINCHTDLQKMDKYGAAAAGKAAAIAG